MVGLLRARWRNHYVIRNILKVARMSQIVSFSSSYISPCLSCTLAQCGGLELTVDHPSVSVAASHQCDSVAFHLSSRFKIVLGPQH
jgi:hypothetical protein